MITRFVNDAAYLAWVDGHSRGFVANVDEPQRWASYPMVHRSSHKGDHPARQLHDEALYYKVCSDNLDDLERWADATFKKKITLSRVHEARAATCAHLLDSVECSLHGVLERGSRTSPGCCRRPARPKQILRKAGLPSRLFRTIGRNAQATSAALTGAAPFRWLTSPSGDVSAGLYPCRLPCDRPSVAACAPAAPRPYLFCVPWLSWDVPSLSPAQPSQLTFSAPRHCAPVVLPPLPRGHASRWHAAAQAYSKA